MKQEMSDSKIKKKVLVVGLEEKVNPKELRELKALKKETLSGKCVSFEDVLKKHGAKRSA
jgi:hypothetical protein